MLILGKMELTFRKEGVFCRKQRELTFPVRFYTMPIGISKKDSFPIDEADCIGKEDSFGSQGMPTVLWKGPYRFFFYSGDRNEPAHIHVEHENRVAKF